MRTFLAGHKRLSTFVVAPLMALAITTASFAAWNYFRGVAGTAAGTLGTATRADAITFTAPGTVSGSLTKASPGTTGDLQTIITNNSGVNEQISGITGVFTATPATCSQYLTLNAGPFTALPTIPAAGLGNLIIPAAYSLDPATPVSCSAATFSVQLTATTNP